MSTRKANIKTVECFKRNFKYKNKIKHCNNFFNEYYMSFKHFEIERSGIEKKGNLRNALLYLSFYEMSL